jgi:nucleoside-diphosphate-sugar epimerase
MPDPIEELEEALSEPTPGVIETLKRRPGDIVILGVAGKMGPSLARMAQRASAKAGTSLRIIGVARFNDAKAEKSLQDHGVQTVRCDLLDEETVAKLPDAPNVFFMAGMKFGATGNEARTWAMNCFLPSLICRRYATSRIVAFSTGNVYGLSPVAEGGATEQTVPQPVGEYAMSCLGRERMFEHFSREAKIPVTLLRLNYACDLRYGVLVDLAQRIWKEEPIDVTMGFFNTIWQRDANAQALQALDHASFPPRILNITGPELLKVREVCEQMAARMNRRARFTGTESNSAILSNARLAESLFGLPSLPAAQLIDRVADWMMQGRATLQKPTHFESRDGAF